MNDISKDKDYQEFFACTEVAFGTVEGLLWYGICARCAKTPSCGTRRIFRGTRCKKQAFLVQE